MNWSRIARISVVVNVVLLGIAAYSFSLLKKISGEPPLPPERLITSTVTQLAVKKISASNFWATLMASRNPSWSMVESTNYVTYIENLRSMGCPQETIQDIIIADIAKLYAKKRAAVRAAGKPAPYWKSEETWSSTPEKQAEDANIKALRQEERALVKHLLDVDLDSELAKFSRGADSPDLTFGYLPAEKRQRVQDLQDQFAELESRIYSASKGLLLDQDQEQLRRLEKQKEEELAKVLSPEELESYQLHTSSTADSLRSQMTGFDATEEEFKHLFRIQKTFDDQFANAFDATDEKQMEVREKAQEAAQQALNEEMKKILGDKRYAEYQRAQDPDYKLLSQVSERFQLGSDSVQKIYDMKQVAEKQKQAVDANQNLTQEQRMAALEAIAAQTKASVAQAMGGKDSQVWKVYQKNGGSWLESLGISENPPMEAAPTPAESVPPTPPFPPFGPPFRPLMVPPGP